MAFKIKLKRPKCIHICLYRHVYIHICLYSTITYNIILNVIFFSCKIDVSYSSYINVYVI